MQFFSRRWLMSIRMDKVSSSRVNGSIIGMWCSVFGGESYLVASVTWVIWLVRHHLLLLICRSPSPSLTLVFCCASLSVSSDEFSPSIEITATIRTMARLRQTKIRIEAGLSCVSIGLLLVREMTHVWVSVTCLRKAHYAHALALLLRLVLASCRS